jgi:rhodanese-related sulfurtransferase
MRPQFRLAVPVLVASFTLLAACGGSGSSSRSPTTPAAATATAGASTESGSGTGHQLLAAGAADRLLRTPPAGLVILDVRTPAEFAAGHLANALDVDVRAATFAADIAKLDPKVPYFVYCHSGNRSATASTYLEQHGFTTIFELQGGITAWQAAGLPVVMG